MCNPRYYKFLSFEKYFLPTTEVPQIGIISKKGGGGGEVGRLVGDNKGGRVDWDMILCNNR